jgi:hypothetical protein
LLDFSAVADCFQQLLIFSAIDETNPTDLAITRDLYPRLKENFNLKS